MSGHTGGTASEEGVGAKAAHLFEQAKTGITDITHRMLPESQAGAGIGDKLSDVATRMQRSVISKLEEVGKSNKSLAEFDDEVPMSRPSSLYFLVALLLVSFA